MVAAINDRLTGEPDWELRVAMADQSISIRLALTDGGKVKAELVDIGASGQKALERIRDAAQPASRGLQALDVAGHAVRGKIQEMAGSAGVLGEALQKIGPYGLAAAAGVGAVTVALGFAMNKAREVTEHFDDARRPGGADRHQRRELPGAGLRLRADRREGGRDRDGADPAQRRHRRRDDPGREDASRGGARLRSARHLDGRRAEARQRPRLDAGGDGRGHEEPRHAGGADRRRQGADGQAGGGAAAAARRRRRQAAGTDAGGERCRRGARQGFGARGTTSSAIGSTPSARSCKRRRAASSRRLPRAPCCSPKRSPR